MENKTVFISYKSEDVDQALWVRRALETGGVACWMAPESIVGGASYAAEIPAAIRNAAAFVLVLSQRTMASKWVAKEVSLAINEGKTVLPFLLEPCTLTDEFNFYLTDVQWYQAWQGRDAAMNKMLREIRAIMGIQEPATPPVQPSPAQRTVMRTGANPGGNTAARQAPPVRTVPGSAPQAAAGSAGRLPVIAGLCGILSVATVGLLVLPQVLALVLALRAAPRLGSDAAGRRWAFVAMLGGNIGMSLFLIVAAAVPGLLLSLLVVVLTVVLYRRKLAK